MFTRNLVIILLITQSAKANSVLAEVVVHSMGAYSAYQEINKAVRDSHRRNEKIYSISKDLTAALQELQNRCDRRKVELEQGDYTISSCGNSSCWSTNDGWLCHTIVTVDLK